MFNKVRIYKDNKEVKNESEIKEILHFQTSLLDIGYDLKISNVREEDEDIVISTEYKVVFMWDHEGETDVENPITCLESLDIKLLRHLMLDNVVIRRDKGSHGIIIEHILAK